MFFNKRYYKEIKEMINEHFRKFTEESSRTYHRFNDSMSEIRKELNSIQDIVNRMEAKSVGNANDIKSTVNKNTNQRTIDIQKHFNDTTSKNIIEPLTKAISIQLEQFSQILNNLAQVMISDKIEIKKREGNLIEVKAVKENEPEPEEKQNAQNNATESLKKPNKKNKK